MSDYSYTLDRKSPFKIGAQGLESIVQNIRIILSTFTYTVPLDRGFANTANAVDSPAPKHSARLIAQLTDALEKYEPRIKIRKLELRYEDRQEQLMAASLTPHVVFYLKEGIKL